MTSFHCPICGNSTNSYGDPFKSEWAVACHVAGKIREVKTDKVHKAWAQENTPGVNFSLPVLSLANKIMPAIIKELEGKKPSGISTTHELLLVIHDIEIKLHKHIKLRLQAHFGTQEDFWWFDGIPLEIRKDCAQRREVDPAHSEPYNYTYLIDLKTIIEKNWLIFESDFLRVRGTINSKKELLDCIRRLNLVRNRYSHPIRAPKTGSKAFKEDITFAEGVEQIINDFCKT